MRSILFLILLLSGLYSQAAEKIYVPFFSCEDCSQQLGRSTTYILVDLINHYEVFEAIIAQKRDTSLFEESVNEVKESAELLSTSYYLIGKIVRLKDNYHISVTLYATSSSMIIWSDIRSTNERNDIPAIMDEIAAHIGSDKKFSLSGDVSRVYSAESKKLNREKGNKSVGMTVGAMIPMSNEEIKSVDGGFGFIGSFDVRNYILQLSAEVYYGNDSIPSGYTDHTFQNRYFNIGTSVLYPLSTTNNAPFVCLGSAFTYRETQIKYDAVVIGISGIPTHDHNVFDSGLTMNAGGGYILKRNSDATLFIYARGYVYIPKVNSVAYGAMLNVALTIGG